MKNIFADIPETLDEELFQTLLDSPHLRIERIISRGHCSPESHWYDQDQGEWILLLKGGAVLEFEGGRRETLKAGDYLDLPAHTRHRVAWTDPQQETVWLAVWY